MEKECQWNCGKEEIETEDTSSGEVITHLRISNFKSHKETSLRMSNLTVLTGVNGGGKTSVVQALLLLRETDSLHFENDK